MPATMTFEGSIALTRGHDRPVQESLGAQLGYWIVDRATGEATGSPGLRAMLGGDLSFDDLDCLLVRVHPEDRGRLIESLSGPFECGEAFTIDFRIGGTEGQVHHLHVGGRAVPVPDDSHEPPGRFLVLTFEDVTECRKAHEELFQVREQLEDRVRELRDANVKLVAEIAAREQTQRDLQASECIYHSLVETVPYAIFRKDPEGRYTFANRRYCEMHGVSTDGLIGKTDYDIYPAELARKYRADDRRTFDRGEILDLERRTPEPQDARTSARSSHTIKCPIIDANGIITGIQGRCSPT